jgi:hypothetical protein
MARPNLAFERFKRLVADIKLGPGGIPRDLTEALVFDIADRARARQSLSGDNLDLLHGILLLLKDKYRETKALVEGSPASQPEGAGSVRQFVRHHPRQDPGALAAQDLLTPADADFAMALFTIARLSYLAGSLCPDKMFMEDRAESAWTERSPKSAALEKVVDKVLLPIVTEHRDWTATRIANKAKPTFKKRQIKVGDRYLRGRIAHLKKVGTTEQSYQESR